MIAFPRTRALVTVVLATSLFLPAYTCAGYKSPQGEVVEHIPAGADSSAYTPTRIPHRPVEELNASDYGWWLTVLAYSWPLLVLGLRLRPKPGRLDRVMHWAELLLACGASFMIYIVASTGRIAYGTWLAWGANAALFTVAILEFMKRRRTSGGT